MERKIIIGVFCYSRANKLKQCINALLKNPECKQLDIVFFSDGFKGEHDKNGVLETRDYINSITGFKSVIKHFRDRNYSTGPNFQEGLTFLSDNYDEFIIVEDDLIVSPNYIKFLMDGLAFYRNKKSVFCITAYVYPIKVNHYSYDTIVYKRFCSYGWAGWADRFKNVIWDHRELKNLMDNSPGFNKRLNAEGYDLGRMIRKQLTGKISTWDVQLQVHVAENRLKVIYPVLSKVNNIGFDEESTNTFGINYLKTPIDNGVARRFKFCDDDLIIPDLQKQIKKPFGLKALISRKVINTFIKATKQVKKAN
ncbi:MAG: glycosyl transferase [Mucilaginibacter sp.]|nr:glycosyl transferase [Mucilaginibacter sp.]